MFKKHIKIDLLKAVKLFTQGDINGFLASFSNAEKSDIDYKQYRIFVSELFFAVLAEKMHAREALLKFPPDIHDPSIQVAWHALCHREADEDIRKRDRTYAEEQDDYLEMLGFTMQNGSELPENIISEYEKYYKEAPIPHEKGIKGIFKKLTRFLNT